MHRQTAHDILKKTFIAAGLNGKLATHSPRKSFAQRLYEITWVSILNSKNAKTHTSRREKLANRRGYPRRTTTVANAPNSLAAFSVLAIHAVGYGQRRDLGKYQTKQTAPGFPPYKRIEHLNGFQNVEMLTKKGKVVGYLNSFDKTADGKLQTFCIKTTCDGDGRTNGNITQLQRIIQRSDGYAYEIIGAESRKIQDTSNFENADQLSLFDVADLPVFSHD